MTLPKTASFDHDHLAEGALAAAGRSMAVPTAPLMGLLLAAFVGYVVVSMLFSAPLLPSDEYAYFISGVFGDRLADLHRLDPALQSVPTLLFLGLIHLVHLMAGNGFVPVFRILHVVEWLAAASILYRTVLGVIGRRDALGGVLLFLLMPSSLYLYAVMPETEVVLAGACLGYLLVVVLPVRPVVAAALAGVVLGAALLMKPHAIAMLTSAIAVVAVAPWFVTGAGRVRSAVGTLVVLLASFYLTVVVLSRLLGHAWAFNPVSVLGLDLYGSSVGGAANGLSIGRKLLDASMYAAAHLAIVVLLFAPAVVWVVATLRRTVGSEGRSDAMSFRDALLALFVATMVLSHVAMTAWFSAGVAASSEGEALRLHGRYLGVALSLLPFVYFAALRRLTPRQVKLSAAAGVFALIVFLGLIRPGLKIFPWDYPLLFAYFAAPNHYGWDFEGSGAAIGRYLPWIVLGLFALALWSKPLARKALLAQLVLVTLAGIVQTYAWADRQSASVRPLVDYSKAVAAMVGADQFGKGLVVSDNRYGDMSTLLFGLANGPRVLVKAPGTVITAADAEGASWILVGNRYRPEFDAAQSVALGPLRFFPRESAAAFSQQEKRLLAVGASGTASLASGRLAADRLTGFNEQEGWGAWTSGPQAEVELPFRIQGEVTVRMFGWVLPENLGTPVTMRIGGASVVVPVTDHGSTVDVRMHVDVATDRIAFESASFDVAPNRRLGLAVGSLSLTRVAP